MMRMWTWVIAGAVLIGGPAASTAVADTAATRGELAVLMARAAGLDLPAQGPEAAAAEALRKAGIDVGARLDAPVTEGLLVALGKAVGQGVVTSRPGAAVSLAISRSFVRSIAPALEAAVVSNAGGTMMINVSCQGRESRNDRKGTPASQANPNATAPPCEEPVP